MKRLLLVLVLSAAVLLPASAPAAGCRPLDCSPNGVALGHGLFAVMPQGILGTAEVVDLHTGKARWQLPGGAFNAHTLVNQRNQLLTWYDALTGKAVGQAIAPGYLAGSSQDGLRAVLSDQTRTRTSFTIATPRAQRTIRLHGGNWGFDALADHNLYLLRYLKNGYQVRLYDLAANRLVAQPLKDPHESSLIWGTPWSRVTSQDGRYVFTLYVGSNGAAMVHELDVRNAVARCIDLPGTGNFNSGTTYALQVAPDGRTLWAVSTGYGRVAAIDIASARVTSAFRFKPAWSAESPGASVAAVSAAGDRLAVANGTDLYVITPATRTVVHRQRIVGSLAFAPDGKRLWVSRGWKVTALRLE